MRTNSITQCYETNFRLTHEYNWCLSARPLLVDTNVRLIYNTSVSINVGVFFISIISQANVLMTLSRLFSHKLRILGCRIFSSFTLQINASMCWTDVSTIKLNNCVRGDCITWQQEMKIIMNKDKNMKKNVIFFFFYSLKGDCWSWVKLNKLFVVWNYLHYHYFVQSAPRLVSWNYFQKTNDIKDKTQHKKT